MDNMGSRALGAKSWGADLRRCRLNSEFAGLNRSAMVIVMHGSSGPRVTVAAEYTACLLLLSY